MKFFARFGSWWAGVSGLVAVGGSCPCCGGAPCPRGVALLGFVGALTALLLKPKSVTQNYETVAESSPHFIDPRRHT